MRTYSSVAKQQYGGDFNSKMGIRPKQTFQMLTLLRIAKDQTPGHSRLTATQKSVKNKIESNIVKIEHTRI
jgi:hypothetical protein